jgi:epoxyqueuosine reductase
MRMLLHACCGPCSIEPMRIFSEEGISYEISYTNSNIHPLEEYNLRIAALKDYATLRGIPVHEGSYDPLLWEKRVALYGTERQARCRACYRLRFEETAQSALKLGFDTISTTLTISPYQFTAIINEELERAAKQRGLKALLRDFRAYYPSATRVSRDLGMYRQNYCGCRCSIIEAETERAARREARARTKEERHRGLQKNIFSNDRERPSATIN